MLSSFIYKEKLYAALWGFIVGDAMGVPYEFLDREHIKENPAVDMVGFGSHHQPIGTWSDDTSLMLCVLEALSNGWGTKKLAELFIKWYDEGYHTAHGRLFDIGNTTQQAFQNIKSGLPLNKTGMNKHYSAGNGSLMRSLPYAFMDPIDESIFRSLFDASLTHRLSICNETCIFYIKYLRLIADGFSKDDALKYAIGFIKHGWRITDGGGSEYSINQFKRLFDGDFINLPENEIQSTGFVIHTIESVVWTFMNSTNYEEAILKAVNLGGDTDTIAALVGGLAGTFYGIDQIPEKWMEQIVMKKELDDFIDKMMK